MSTEENNKPTATIIQTTDGMNIVKYSDGSIQTGTVEQLTDSLSSSYNVVTQQSDYIGMDIIGEHQLEYADQIAQMNASGQQGFGAQQQATYADSVETGFTPDRPEELTFDPDSAVGKGKKFFGLGGDKASYVILSDGTRIQSTQGNTASEIQDALRIAQIYVDRRNAAISAWDKLYGNVGDVIDQNAESQIATLIQSYNHYVQTGQDDGGGFINTETGLPIGAANEAEAFLMRTGNYVMSKDTLLGILDNSSDALKQSLSQNYFFDDPTLDGWTQTRERVAQDFLNVIGNISDNRNFGMLLAVSGYSSDAFVNALGVANIQSYQVGQPNFDPETGKFLGYNKGNVTFGMVNGQPMMTGVAGNSQFIGGSSPYLSTLFVDPSQIQGIVEGNVYSKYQQYYDDHRKGFEFLNKYDFLSLDPLADKKITDTSGLDVAPGSGGMGPQDFTGLDAAPDYSGLSSGIGTAQTFNTAGSAPVTYDTQQVQQTFDTSQPALGSPSTGTSPQAPVSGTFNLPTQTANLSAVPQTITTQTDYTGTNMANLTSPSQGVGGVQQVVYQNPATDQEIRMTEINGSPIGVVPPGFVKVSSAAQGAYIKGYAPGGLVEAEKSMAAKFLNFKGGDLEKFLEANPAAAAKMGKYRTALRNKMIQKGTVFAQSGTFVDAANQLSGVSGLSAPGDPYQQKLAAMQRGAIQQTMQPLQSNVQMLVPQAADFTPTGAGQAYPVAPFAQAATVPSTAQAGMPMTQPASFMLAGATSPQVQAQTGALQAVEGEVSEQAQVDAAQQLQTSVSGIEAAQGTATMIDNPVQRQIQQGEIISGSANAETASKFTEQIEAATATPTKKATVAGQLEDLMADFEGGETPAWAAGSMRTAMATLSARGLGASSLAGQAVVQAAMEAALPIAQMDAQVQAQFEGQNLSNRQQRAMLAAQQRASFIGQEFDQSFQARVANASRIADIANMNFNAEQQIALENARASNTMSLSNLTNTQAMVMAEAAALSQLDMANLNNRQQAAVQNAQNFLQMDMTNLSNEQQTAMFKTQQNVNSILTDVAAGNAAAQFNATSDNQTNQFFASLTSQVSQFNSTQQNAMDQFNVNSVNALREFNSELQQQRDLFNAQNGLVVAQSNAQWRQNIATMNTAALNESNATYARTINGLTEANMSQIWQRERDIMSFAFQTANNNADRATSIAVQNLQNEATKDQAAAQKSASFAKAAGTIIGAIIGS